jgi:predicted 3-demethylubiquinone-9 3-methyltransferase (glyoxalase superfamily)
MNRQSIVPCLWFDNQAEQAAQFYTETFPAGRVTALSCYPESTDNPAGKPRGSVLTVEFEVAGQRFTALNGGPLSAARDRAFNAVMCMKKLDIATIQAAFDAAR